MSKIKFYTQDKLNRVSLLEVRSEARKVSDALIEKNKGSIPMWSSKPKTVLISDILWGYNQLGYPVNDVVEPDPVMATVDDTETESTPIEDNQVEEADFEDIPEDEQEPEDDEDLLTDTDDEDIPEDIPEDEPDEEPEEIPSKSEIVRGALQDGIDDLDTLEELLLEYYPDIKRSQVSTYKSQQKKKLGL